MGLFGFALFFSLRLKISEDDEEEDENDEASNNNHENEIEAEK